MATSAGVKTQDKYLTIFRVEDETDGKRPDLLMTKQGTNGCDLYVDVTVSHPTCPKYAGHACKERGYTIKKKNGEKIKKYDKKCERLGYQFVPLAFESFGLASKQVVDLISSLAEKASELLCIPYALLLSYWKKRISTTLQVGTAQFIMNASKCSRRPQRDQRLEDSILLESNHVRTRH